MFESIHNVWNRNLGPINSQRYQEKSRDHFLSRQPRDDLVAPGWPPGQSDRCSRCRSRLRLERFSQVDGTTREIFGILGRAAVCWDHPVQTQGFVSVEHTYIHLP